MPAMLYEAVRCYAGAATIASAGCEAPLKLLANSISKLGHAAQRHVTLCYSMLCRSRQERRVETAKYVVQCGAMQRYTIHVMQCYEMLCDVMQCCAIICNAPRCSPGGTRSFEEAGMCLQCYWKLCSAMQEPPQSHQQAVKHR